MNKYDLTFLISVLMTLALVVTGLFIEHHTASTVLLACSGIVGVVSTVIQYAWFKRYFERLQELADDIDSDLNLLRGKQ